MSHSVDFSKRLDRLYMTLFTEIKILPQLSGVTTNGPSAPRVNEGVRGEEEVQVLSSRPGVPSTPSTLPLVPK